MRLLVMRLADMRKVHPDQITACCARCGHEVGIYPSGQAVIAGNPEVDIVCTVCHQPAGATLMPAPGALRESSESVPRK